MIDTNALLNFGFSIIAAFSNIVAVPNGSVPVRVEDLAKYVVDPAHSPPDLYLVDRRGAEFWIRDGAGYRFRTPGSWRSLQDMKDLSKFLGPENMTEAQALSMARAVVLNLIRKPDALVGVSPVISSPGPVDGQNIPFYYVGWPKTNSFPFRYYAVMEIDARKGQITFLHLPDPCFKNYELATEMTSRLLTRDSPVPPFDPRPPPVHPPLPYPDTNQVRGAIASWLWLCERVGVAPGTCTNLDTVDWDRSMAYDNPWSLPIGPAYQVWFTNGVSFEAVAGVVFGHFSADQCFGGPWQARTREQWAQFRGPIRYAWRDLATKLQCALKVGVGIPASLVDPFRPSAGRKPPQPGSIAFTRRRVSWLDWPKRPGIVYSDEARRGFSAEFDLGTGELKYFAVSDVELFRALASAQHKYLPSAHVSVR